MIAMRVVFVLALVACSDARPANPKELEPVGIGFPPPPKHDYVRSGAATPPPAPNQEVDAALKSLWSDHERDVPPITWWKAHAPEVRPQLTAWLADGKDDGNGDLRAMRILGDIGEASDIEVLAHVLTTWTTETSRAQAAAALGVHAAPGATLALVEATKLADIAIASHATSALGLREDDVARTRLEELLRHDDATLRSRAASAMKKR
jgi:hypothetical protein